MARKALVVKQQKLQKKFELRLKLRKEAKEQGKPMPKIKGFSRTKYYNRCRLSGRSKSYMREFGVDRITFRKYAREGKIMGVRKASR